MRCKGRERERRDTCAAVEAGGGVVGQERKTVLVLMCVWLAAAEDVCGGNDERAPGEEGRAPEGWSVHHPGMHRFATAAARFATSALKQKAPGGSHTQGGTYEYRSNTNLRASMEANRSPMIHEAPVPTDRRAGSPGSYARSGG